MTSDDLIKELKRFSDIGGLEVFIAIDRDKCSPLLGVFADSGRVILDPSANEEDYRGHALASRSVTGKAK